MATKRESMRLVAGRFRRETPEGRLRRIERGVVARVRRAVASLPPGHTPATAWLVIEGIIPSLGADERLLWFSDLSLRLSGEKGGVRPDGGDGAVRLNATWGVQCSWCMKEGNRSCPHCASARRDLDGLPTLARAELQELHRAAEDGDGAAVMAAIDWATERFGTRLGLWWPGLEWDEEGEQGHEQHAG